MYFRITNLWKDTAVAVININYPGFYIVGVTFRDYRTVGLLSVLDKFGYATDTWIMSWPIAVVFQDAIYAKSTMYYVGYAGEGVSNLDMLVVASDISGNVHWAKTYNVYGQDQADLIAECDAGIVVVGKYKNAERCFIALMDVSGELLSQHSMLSCSFNSIKCLKSGDFAVLGHVVKKQKQLGLLFMVNIDCAISGVFHFAVKIPSSIAVAIYDIVEKSYLHFLAIMDSYEVISGQVFESLIIAEFKILINGIILI